MGGRHCGRHVARAGDRFSDGKRTAPEPRRERFAIDELHDDEVDAAFVTDVVDGADVWMIESRNRERFALETRARIRLVQRRRRQHLDRDDAVQASVAGFVDLSHTAGAEQPKQFVCAEAGADFDTHDAGLWVGLYRRASGERHQLYVVRQRALAAERPSWTLMHQ